MGSVSGCRWSRRSSSLHGGNVTAGSAGHGEGTEFVVRLPLDMRAEELDTAAEGQERQAASVRSGKRRVLIIEDNVDAADSLRDALELDGHAVEVAYSGPEGLARAREFAPEVVLCDIGLPGIDGYEVAHAFRSDQTLRGVFLVALTGYALPEDIERASMAGFERHVAKPPCLEQLYELLRHNHVVAQ